MQQTQQRVRRVMNLSIWFSRLYKLRRHSFFLPFFPSFCFLPAHTRYSDKCALSVPWQWCIVIAKNESCIALSKSSRVVKEDSWCLLISTFRLTIYCSLSELRFVIINCLTSQNLKFYL